MLKVLLTADVECWPDDYRYDTKSIKKAFDKYYLGKTRNGVYGMPYILKKLSQYDLKSTFFIDTLLSQRTGGALLENMVHPVLEANQEAQLHLHVEFLDNLGATCIRRRDRENLSQFSAEEQHTLLGEGVEALKRVGVDRIVAFRAGNFGANTKTLAALEKLGIKYDSSYDHTYHTEHHSFREKSWDRCPTAPYREGNVIEFPIGYFEQWSLGLRRVQLTACSFAEMRHYFESAYRNRYQYCVLVFHSFELLRPKGRQSPDPIVVNRFEQLCKYLAQNRDRFETCHFQDIASPEVYNNSKDHPPLIRCTPGNTLMRNSEQLIRYLPTQLISPALTLMNTFKKIIS